MSLVGAPREPKHGVWLMPPPNAIGPGMSSPEIKLSNRTPVTGSLGDLVYSFRYAGIEYEVGLRFSDPATGRNEAGFSVTTRAYDADGLLEPPGTLLPSLTASSGDDGNWQDTVPLSGHPLRIKWVIEEASEGTILTIERVTGKKLSEFDDEIYLTADRPASPLRVPTDDRYHKFRAAGTEWTVGAQMHIADDSAPFDIVVNEYDPVSADDRLGTLHVDPAQRKLTAQWETGDVYRTDFDYEKPVDIGVHSFRRSNRDAGVASDGSGGLPSPNIESVYEFSLTFRKLSG